MLLSYINEPNEFVWDIISLTLNGFKKFVDEDEKSELRLKSFYRMMAIKQYDRLGWVKTSHESDNDTKLRPLIIGMMLYSDDSLAIAKALEIYESHKESIETIDSELRAVILCAAVRKGSIQGIVNDLVNAYKKISSVELKHDLAAAITSTKNVDSIKYILSNFKNTDTIKPQDVTSWYVYSLRNKYSRDLTWQWLTNNWEWIEDNFKSDMSYDDFPKYTAGALTTQDYLNKYTAFFSPMMGDKALARSISVGINEIQSKISLIQRDRDAVCKKLESYDNIFSGL
jgi:aminopeptidase N